MNKKLIHLQYELLKAYRSQNPAPVDTMGCEAHFDRGSKDFENQKFRLLVSLLLSVQTNDMITDSVVGRLTKDGITKEKFAGMSLDALRDKIKEVNFSTKKAEYIQALAKQTLDKAIPEE